MNQPQAPDPYATAAAQTQSSEQTAKYQQSLNQTNQITPYGSVQYQQTGTSPDGAPISTATTTLAPAVQNLVDSNIANNQAESGIAGQLASNAASTLSHPLDLGPTALQGEINKQNAVTLDPYWARQDAQTEQTAYDRGLQPGSDGYSAAMQNEGTLKNQSYAQSYQGAAQQAQNALMQQYNEPLNALSALQSGSQVSQPGVGQTANAPQTSVAGTNIAGLVEQNYQQQLAQSNASMGGLFGLGGAALQAGGSALSGGGLGALLAVSDRRLKTDVSRVGVRPDGIPLYVWRYLWGGPLQIGPMAQDVQALYPEAVVDLGGFLAIDFARLP